MNQKEKISTILITSFVLLILVVAGYKGYVKNNLKSVYQVYLNGQKLGLIANQQELLNLINEEQTDIKKEYGVDNVYPPNGFEIKEYLTYNNQLTSSEEIYNKVKENGDFTIKGYTVTLTEKNPLEGKDPKKSYIYVLDDDIFKSALKQLATAFVTESQFENYINNTQEEIDGVGQVIKTMDFDHTYTIKESNISVNEKIYTDTKKLSQFLMYGSDNSNTKYKVQKGDTIASIAESNKLNTRELMIANPQFKTEQTMLAIGDEVNVDLINPIINLIQTAIVIEDNEQFFEKKKEIDKTKPSSYSEIKQAGVTGIVRITREVTIKNGQLEQEAKILNSNVIREAVDEITVIGKKQNSGGGGNQFYDDTGNEWKWPTNQPYIITSPFGWRDGSYHDALDISGTGVGSSIYAAKNGKVVETYANCPTYGYLGNTCGGTYGNHIIIDHGDNTYTMYAHLISNLEVKVGDVVTRGQEIGHMGSSGSSSGTHLHFGVSIGYPDRGRWINPAGLYK